MFIRWSAIFGFLLVLSSFAGLAMGGWLFARGPVSGALQVLSLGLILWARRTLGGASFYPLANARLTELITVGPYAWLRHPIYSSLLVFVWAGACSNSDPRAYGCASAATIGSLIRAGCEEVELTRRFTNYACPSRKLHPHRRTH